MHKVGCYVSPVEVSHQHPYLILIQGLLPTCFRMFSGILCSGTWPGPSFITWHHGSHTVTAQVINRLYSSASMPSIHEYHLEP